MKTQSYNKNFSLKMKSFIFDGELNKNNSVQKVTDKMSNNNTNPFFQYVNNNKSVHSLGLTSTNKTENSQIKPQSQLNDKQSQRKNSDLLIDPRKPPITNKTLPQPTKSPQQPKKLSTQTRPQVDDLREKRSRSRDDRISKNRENSQEDDKMQKKEEHFHKTKLCPLYEKGECKKGVQCHFAHGFKQLRGLPNFFKTRLCLSFQKGECKKSSSQCKYAHGQNQLRGLRHDAGYSNTVSKGGNDDKTNLKDERRNFNDEKRKYYDRDNQEDRKDRKNKDRRDKDRDSQSSHRKDRNRKDSSSHKGQSNDRKKKSQKEVENPLSYKKNIPLNKQYEKYLYSNPDFKGPQSQSNSFANFQDSMYMIPHGMISPSTYKQDIYGLNQGKQIEKIIPSPYPQMGQQKSYPQYNPTAYKQFSNIDPSYNYADQLQSSQKSYYENLSNKQTQRNFNYSNPQNKFSQKSYAPQTAYPPNSQPYGSYSNAYPPVYQAPKEFISEFSKDSYKGFSNNNFADQQTFRNQKNSQQFFSKDNGFSGDSYYSNLQLNPSLGVPNESNFDIKPQSFYKDDSFYPSTSVKKSEPNFLPQNQSSLNAYQPSYPSNGVYNLYPALDNTVNTNQSQKYPYPYEKSKYSSGFSNNLPK